VPPPEILSFGGGRPTAIAAVPMLGQGAAAAGGNLAALGVQEEVLLHGAVQTLMAPYRNPRHVLQPTRPVSDCQEVNQLQARLVCAALTHRSCENTLQGAPDAS